jgi:O-antigen/teichoic acid export membrane protein
LLCVKGLRGAERRPLSTAPEGTTRGLSTIVIRGAGVATAGYFLTQAITLGSYIVLARLAGPEVFGSFAAAWIIVGVSTFLTESGMSAALIQRRDGLEAAAATAVLSTLATGIGLALIALALSPLVGLYFGSGEIGLLSAALSGVLIVNAATVVPDALMRRRFAFVRRVVVDPVNAAVYGISAVVALTLGMGAWGLVIATYVAGVVRVPIVWIFNRWLPDLRMASFAMWRELASYARHVALSELLREISGVANTALLGRFLGIAPLGGYRFGWRMATEAANPLTSSAYMLLPAFARIAHDLNRFQRAFLRSARLLSAVVFPVSLAVFVLGEQIGVTLLGERWREAGSVLAALAGVTLAVAFVQLASEVFKAANRPDLLPKMTLVRTVASLILMIAFLPLGPTGVAAGVSIAYLLSLAYAWRDIGRVLALPPRTLSGVLVVPALASSGMAVVLAIFVAYVARPENGSTPVRLAWLLLEVAVGALVYLALLFRLSPATVKDLREVIRRFRHGGRDEPLVPPASDDPWI